MKVLPALWTSFFILSIGSTVGFRKADEGVRLRLVLEPGQSISYDATSITQTMLSSGTQISESQMRQVYDIMSKKDDEAVVLFSIRDFTLKGKHGVTDENLKKMAADVERSRMEFVVDQHGMPSKSRVLDSAEKPKGFYGLAIQNGLFGFGFPEEAVRVGSTWKGSVDLGEVLHQTSDAKVLSKVTKIPITYTVDKVEDGVVTISTLIEAKIKIQTKSGPAELYLYNQGTSDLDAETGILIKSKSSGKAVNFIEGFGPVRQNLSFEIARRDS